MADEPGFTIDGERYPVPVIGSFDMDEAEILYDATGYVLSDFMLNGPDGKPSDERIDELIRMLENPKLLRVLLYVAYRRGNRDVKDQQIREAVGRVPFADASREWSELFKEDDESPPDRESTSEHDGTSPSELVDSNGTSGAGSAPTSDDPASLLASTTGGS